MASKADAEKDNNVDKPCSQSTLESINDPENRKPVWNETCIGIWSQNILGKSNSDREPKPICKGINIIRIPKGTKEKDIIPSRTSGISIRIIENDDEPDNSTKKSSRSSTNSAALKEEESPSLLDSISSSFTRRREAVVNRIHHYRSSPDGKQELWTDFQNSSEKQLTTARRLLSYAQPREKISQMGGIMYSLVQSAKDWVAGKK